MQRLFLLFALIALPTSMAAKRAIALKAIDAAIEEGIRRGIYPAAR